jgi:transcription elongation factor GreB
MGRQQQTAVTTISPYITPGGYERLRQELEQLWVRRRDVTQHLSAAAAEGDRSENAEYIYRKKELREIDRRIRYLQKRLPELKVVRDKPSSSKQVFFGAWITLQNGNGDKNTYRIVGADEFDPDRHFISVDSPMAKALLKKHVKDMVTVQTLHGTNSYKVIDVQYASDAN